MRLKSIILCFILSSCLPTIERNGLEFLFLFKSTNKLTSSSTPLTISYSGSPYTFTQSIPINTITPTTSGSILSCSANPSLPAGLSLDNASCAISGTPTTIQAATIYTITASNISTSASTNISITVSANAPANLVYAGSPFSFSQNIAITNERTKPKSKNKIHPHPPARRTITWVHGCLALFAPRPKECSGSPLALQSVLSYYDIKPNARMPSDLCTAGSNHELAHHHPQTSAH